MDETALLEKVRALPAFRQWEVIDFVDFLAKREDDVRADGMSELSEQAFARVWDNPDDAEYDRL